MADDVKRILPRELAVLLGRGTVTVLDLRRGSWETSDAKIPGAVRVEPDSYQDYAGQLPRGRTIVTYCT